MSQINERTTTDLQSNPQMAAQQIDMPTGNLSGFVKYFKYDFVSGFLVFLIALPLCLGISLASGYPPLAGIFTAIIGSLLATCFSNSELTIKGPAAGLIVIAIGCIEAFGGDGMEGGWTAIDQNAYRAALAVGVAAAVLQVCFGIFRAGILGDFFPSAAVHGMLAAIGVIIISKQFPVALGVSASGSPFELLGRIPEFIASANPAIAAIGLVSMFIMFVWPMIGRKFGLAKRVPSPLVVLLVAVPMGMAFDLLHEHSYTLQGHQYQLDDHYLVAMPDRPLGMFNEITTPDFSALQQPQAWTWVFMFFVIGSLESLLSAKAVDLLDPWKRKSNMDRDVIAVGFANMAASFIGGLPMISEIVRSKANIDNGARTRFANMWHGVFLLVCVALIPMILHRIPLAALAAMLVYTGFRLAHPNEFLQMLRIGREQLVVFVTTLIAVLATDLLIGILIGIATKFAIHVANGLPISSLLRPGLEIISEDEKTVRIKAGRSAVFSNWIAFRRQLEQVGLLNNKSVALDLSETEFVDHSTMDKLHELESDFQQQGLQLELIGLDFLQPKTKHEYAARRRGLARARRLTVVVEGRLEETICRRFLELGASGYTTTECGGVGRRTVGLSAEDRRPLVKIEVIADHLTTTNMLRYLQTEVMPSERVTACLETVEVDRLQHFVGQSTALSDASGALKHEPRQQAETEHLLTTSVGSSVGTSVGAVADDPQQFSAN